MKQQWVSVVIPSYERELTLVKRAIDSILNQSHPLVEVVLVDDNPLNSPYCEPLKAYCGSDERIKYLRTAGKEGACIARNKGVSLAKGEYVGFLDDDDEWLPQKIELSLPYFQENIVMVGSRGWEVTINNQGKILQKVEYMGNLFRTEPTFQSMLRCDTIGTTTIALVHKQRFLECGGFNSVLPARQDYDCWLRMLKKYRILMIKDFLFIHYLHENEQVSKNPQNALLGLQKVYKDFKQDFDADKQGYAYIHMLMLKRYQELGQKRNELLYLLKVLKVQPRYLGRYIIDKTKNKKLKKFLQKYQKNSAVIN